MSGAALNIMVRTVKRRMENGENIEEILNSYPKLTFAESEQIREEAEAKK